MADDQSRRRSRTAPDFSNWTCPLPLADYPTIVMGHGGGGKLGNELVEHLFLPAFRNPALENLGDAAVLELGGGRLAMSTDSFVVQPLFFPGGSIGELAVNGTVNDLAVSGAEPKFLSASFILEEGFPLAQLAAIVDAMAEAAATAGVQDRHRRHQGRRARPRRRLLHQHRRRRRAARRASTSVRIARSLATPSWSPAPSAITAWPS